MDDVVTSSFTQPPQWSLVLGDVGRWLVIGSGVLFVLAVIGCLFFAKQEKLQIWSQRAIQLGSAFLLGTFGVLAILFANNRFEYEYIWNHGDSKNALAYRIAGVWSGQQGSFLLWACCAAIFAMLTVGRVGKYRRWYSVAYSLFLGSLSGILAFESPFNLSMVNGQPVVPPDGAGLAPSLQNYWVTIHPPTIFLGFGSLTVLFALAFAAMMEKDYETWTPMVRPWALVSVSLVGLGLCMGGFWAYETLGWGGFWMWDPVENVSFVPWCMAVAFSHGVLVQITRKRWFMTNILLGGLPFITFVYGTFLTRSGFLADASVHSFAEMNRSALKLLIGVMAVSTLGFTGLWAKQAIASRKQVREPAPKNSRESFLLSGVMLVLALGLVTLIGMSMPVVMALQGKSEKVVEEGLYHQVMPWMFIPMMVVMGIAPFVGWKGMTLKELWQPFFTLLCISVGLTGITLIAIRLTSFAQVVELSPVMRFPGNHEVRGLAWLLLLMGLCYFVVVSSAWRTSVLIKRSKLGWMPFLAHAGVAILMAGLILSRGLEQQDQALVSEGQPGAALNYQIFYKGMTSNTTDRNNHALFEVRDVRTGNLLFIARPGLYTVKSDNGPDNTMVWPYIEHRPLYDIYVSLKPPQTRATDPMTIGLGKSMTLSGLKVTYLETANTGTPGMAGAKFGAKLKIHLGHADKIVVPTMELGGGSTVSHPAALDDQVSVSLLGMNASDKSISLQFQLNTPIYPIEIYHKPLTILVWFGTGLMTLAGLLTAFYRRRRVLADNMIGTQNSATPGGRPVVNTI